MYPKSTYLYLTFHLTDMDVLMGFTKLVAEILKGTTAINHLVIKAALIAM